MNKIVPFSLKNADSLIEYVLPAQKISIESFKEQSAGSGKNSNKSWKLLERKKTINIK